MDNISFVTNSLEYFDKNNEVYKNMSRYIRYTKIIGSELDNVQPVIVFYDKNKDEIFRSRYEVLGIYTPITSTWAWAWSIPYLRKNNTSISRKILNYGTTLDPEALFLKTELITSRFRIADPIQIDIHVSVASYLTKTPLIYQWYTYEAPIIDEHDIREETHENIVITNYLFLLDHKNIDEYINKQKKEVC